MITTIAVKVFILFKSSFYYLLLLLFIIIIIILNLNTNQLNLLISLLASLVSLVIHVFPSLKCVTQFPSMNSTNDTLFLRFLQYLFAPPNTFSAVGTNHGKILSYCPSNCQLTTNTLKTFNFSFFENLLRNYNCYLLLFCNPGQPTANYLCNSEICNCSLI